MSNNESLPARKRDSTNEVTESLGQISGKTIDLAGDITLEGSIGKIYLDDIAGELGISKSWASRLHTSALAELRGALEA